MPRPSILYQQAQQFLSSYRSMDALDQRLMAACTELLMRDGLAGWVRLRTALDIGLDIGLKAERRRRKTRGQRRTPAGPA